MDVSDPDGHPDLAVDMEHADLATFLALTRQLRRLLHEGCDFELSTAVV
jgi:hypothetical protein